MLCFAFLFWSYAVANTYSVTTIMNKFTEYPDISTLPFPPLLLADLLDQHKDRKLSISWVPKFSSEGLEVTEDYRLKDPKVVIGICGQLPTLLKGYPSKDTLYTSLEAACRSSPDAIFSNESLLEAIKLHMRTKRCYIEMVWKKTTGLYDKLVTGGPLNRADIKIMTLLSTSPEYMTLIRLMDTLDMDSPDKKGRTGTLGAGAFGRVCKTEANRAQKIIPIKSVNYARLISKEIEAMKRVSSDPHFVSSDPHFVSLHSAQMGSLDSVKLTMDFLEGLDGDAFHRGFQFPMPLNVLAAIARHLLLGLQTLHTKARVIHTDLKPANIFFTRTGEVKILDLGLAKYLDDPEDLKRKSGTPGFVGPEYFKGNTVLDVGYDIWGLGATLFYLLNGTIITMFNEQDGEDWKQMNIKQLAVNLPNFILDRIGELSKFPELRNAVIESDFYRFLLKCFIEDSTKRPRTETLLQDPFLKQAVSDHDLSNWIKNVGFVFRR